MYRSEFQFTVEMNSRETAGLNIATVVF